MGWNPLRRGRSRLANTTAQHRSNPTPLRTLLDIPGRPMMSRDEIRSALNAEGERIKRWRRELDLVNETAMTAEERVDAILELEVNIAHAEMEREELLEQWQYAAPEAVEPTPRERA